MLAEKERRTKERLQQQRVVNAVSDFAKPSSSRLSLDYVARNIIQSGKQQRKDDGTVTMESAMAGTK